ncbi:hypothetical protein [uncultured Endozoicomonas sp.]|uniref:hypothetical protein n=1 Tax=uncultured Endozoicomonas sp. TaxID=432652 RepID=UPI002627043B|nr:hypothetical protein [uncultured Endozoicomonas sp.]
MIKLKFNNKTVTVKTHPENDELYCLNDIHKASGGTGKLTDLTKNLNEKVVRRFSIVSINGGKLKGTYANEHSVSFSPKGM